MTALKKKAIAWLALFVICLLIGGVVSIYLGQDANWDLKNYHLYSAWAYLHHRLATDLFAAGIQSYFAPLLDLPYYLLATQWLPNSPRIVAFFMGLPYGLLLFLVFAMIWLTLNQFEDSPVKKVLLSALATAFGVTGVATISQVGTTFNEIPTAATTLGGLLFILIAIAKSNADRANPGIYKYLIFSGLLFGSAAGLKLTSCIYAPGAALVISAISGSLWQRFYRTLAFSTTWLIAFLLLWGPWGLSLYKLTGNPFFPIFNSIFHSAWIAPSNGFDTRFLPVGTLEAIFYPFYWANNQSMTVMEPRFIDPRFAIVFAVFLLFIALHIPTLLRWASRRNQAFYILTPVDGALLFFVISYLIWETFFSILRYAATLESILGLVLLALITKIWIAFKSRPNFVMSLIFISCALIGAAAPTKYPDWGRVPYSHKVFEIKAPKIPKNSLILFISKPIAYLAPFLSRNGNNISYIGITGSALNPLNHNLNAMIHSKIDEWKGPIFYVARKETIDSSGVLKTFSLYPAGNCSRISSNIDEMAYLCPATKTKTDFSWPSLSGDQNYPVGDLVSISGVEGGHIYDSSGWSVPESWGTWTDGTNASIDLRLPNIQSDSLTLNFMSHAFIVPTHPSLHVTVLVNDHPLHTFEYSYPRDTNDSLRSVTIPSNLLAKSKGVLKIDFQVSNPVSPSSLGLSTDSRTLGLGLAWLEVINHPKQ